MEGWASLRTLFDQAETEFDLTFDKIYASIKADSENLATSGRIQASKRLKQKVEEQKQARLATLEESLQQSCHSFSPPRRQTHSTFNFTSPPKNSRHDLDLIPEVPCDKDGLLSQRLFHHNAKQPFPSANRSIGYIERNSKNLTSPAIPRRATTLSASQMPSPNQLARDRANQEALTKIKRMKIGKNLIDKALQLSSTDRLDFVELYKSVSRIPSYRQQEYLRQWLENWGKALPEKSAMTHKEPKKKSTVIVANIPSITELYPTRAKKNQKKKKVLSSKEKTVTPRTKEQREFDHSARNIDIPSISSKKPSTSESMSLTRNFEFKTIESILDNDIACRHYLMFLKKCYCEENLEFLTDVKRYCISTSEADRSSQAQEIYDTYIVCGSPKEINISASAREEVIQGLSNSENLASKPFSIAKREVLFTLNNNNSLNRFKQSDYHKKCIRELKVGTPPHHKYTQNISHCESKKSTLKSKDIVYSLETLVSHKRGRYYLQQFLRELYCEEHVEFLAEVLGYEKLTHNEYMIRKARRIYRTYLESGSPKEISICRSKVSSVVNGFRRTPISYNLFDSAKADVLNVLNTNNTLNRFKRSSYGIALKEELGSSCSETDNSPTEALEVRQFLQPPTSIPCPAGEPVGFSEFEFESLNPWD